MSLHTRNSQHSRSSARERDRKKAFVHGQTTFRDKNICPQCSSYLLAPDWSEHLSERSVRHLWSCEVCSYGFETIVVFPPLGGVASAA
jgi:ribosomal protein L37AE/L43A